MTTNGQIVAQPGDIPIGVLPGVAIGGASPLTDTPVMDLNGTVLFRGRLTGAGIGTNNERALFLGRTSSDLRQILQAGDLDPSGTYPNSTLAQVSGGTGLPLGSNLFSSQRLSPQGGFLMFGAQLYDGGNPGLDGLNHTTLGGTVNVNDTVLYWGFPNSLQILAQRYVTTMPAPSGALLTASFSSFSHQSTALNSSGLAIFRSTLALGVGDTNPTAGINDEAWIVGTPNNLSYLIRKGDPVAAAGGGTLFQLGSNCVLNEAGQALHDERLALGSGTPAVTTADDQMVLVTTGGVHAILMREGDAAASPFPIGTLPGIFYGAPTIAQSFSATGKTGFQASMTGAVTAADDGAVFLGGVGTVEMVAREGDMAPGTGTPWGVFFTGSLSYTDAAGLAFGATLVQGGSVTAMNDSGFWIAQGGGAPAQLIVREGDPAPGMPGFVFGNANGSFNFGSSATPVMNERGQLVFAASCFDAVNVVINGGTFSYDPLHGIQLQLRQGDTLGSHVVSSNTGTALQFPSGDSSPLGLTQNGDFVLKPGFTVDGGIVRGHIGSFHTVPSAIDAVAGGSTNFTIDVTPTYGLSVYVILGTMSGTRPGFPSPLGPQTIPLNSDAWTQLTLSLADSVVYPNSLWFTDVLGQGTSALSLPPSVPGVQGLTLHHAVTILNFNTLASTFVSEPTAVLLR